MFIPMKKNLWGHFFKNKCVNLYWKNLAVIREKYKWVVNACGLHFESDLLIWNA